MRYKIRCYKRSGDLDHEEFFDTLEEAETRRTEWGLSIGLRPEPSSDFAYYPTIWKEVYADSNIWNRVEGY